MTVNDTVHPAVGTLFGLTARMGDEAFFQGTQISPMEAFGLLGLLGVYTGFSESKPSGRDDLPRPTDDCTRQDLNVIDWPIWTDQEGTVVQVGSGLTYLTRILSPLQIKEFRLPEGVDLFKQEQLDQLLPILGDLVFSGCESISMIRRVSTEAAHLVGGFRRCLEGDEEDGNIGRVSAVLVGPFEAQILVLSGFLKPEHFQNCQKTDAFGYLLPDVVQVKIKGKHHVFPLAIKGFLMHNGKPVSLASVDSDGNVVE